VHSGVLREYKIFLTVEKICLDVIEPLVPRMDQEAMMDPTIIQTLFENGVSNMLCIK